VIWPDSRLTRKAEQLPDDEFGHPELNQFIINMFSSLKELNGLGLSACQLADYPNVAIFVYKVGDREGVMINPKIIADSGTMKHESQEGCLSFPGVYVKTQRFNHVTVQYKDEEGQQHEEELIGLLGDCVQHEIEHLNGKTIMDYISRLKKDIVTRKMKKLGKRIEIARKVNANAARRAFKAPRDVGGAGVQVLSGRRDTGLHRVHLPSE